MVWITREAKRAETAAHVHDTAVSGPQQQRQHSLGDRDDAENVRIVNLPHAVQISLAGGKSSFSRDPGVVHENVQASVGRVDLLSGGGNGIGLSYIQNQSRGGQTLG